MKWIVRIAVLVALAAFVAFRVDLPALSLYLKPQLLSALLASQPLIVLAFLAFALRLRLVAPAPAPSFPVAFNAFVLPIGLNIAVPARLSEFAKPAYLFVKAGVRPAAGLSILAIEKVFDLVVVGALAAFLLPAAYLSYAGFWITVGLCAALAATPWAVAAAARFVPAGGGRLMSLVRTLLGAVADVAQRGRYWPVLALSVCGWAASMLSVYVCLALAGSRTIGLVEAGIVFVLTLIGGLVAILPAGMGTFQAAALVGLIGFGYSHEEALVLAVLLQIQALLYATLHTAVVLVGGNFDLASVRSFVARR